MTTTEAITTGRPPDGTGQASLRLITRPLLVRFRRRWPPPGVAAGGGCAAPRQAPWTVRDNAF